MRDVIRFMMLPVAVSLAMFLVAMVWRGICFFRREGSCKFVNCPFREDYMSMNDLSLLNRGRGCTKCRPTRQEMESQLEGLRALAKEYACHETDPGRDTDG